MLSPGWFGDGQCECCAGSGKGLDYGAIKRDVVRFVKKEGKSLRWLANEIGVSVSHLVQMMEGTQKRWKIEHLKKLYRLMFPNRGTREFEE